MKMIKAVLSLVLCLLLAVSAFPVAFAEEPDMSVTGTVVEIE